LANHIGFHATSEGPAKGLGVFQFLRIRRTVRDWASRTAGQGERDSIKDGRIVTLRLPRSPLLWELPFEFWKHLSNGDCDQVFILAAGLVERVPYIVSLNHVQFDEVLRQIPFHCQNDISTLLQSTAVAEFLENHYGRRIQREHRINALHSGLRRIYFRLPTPYSGLQQVGCPFEHGKRHTT